MFYSQIAMFSLFIRYLILRMNSWSAGTRANHDHRSSRYQIAMTRILSKEGRRILRTTFWSVYSRDQRCELFRKLRNKPSLFARPL